MTERDIGGEAVDIANDIEVVLRGRTTAASIIAISMVLGAMETLGTRPNIDGLMKLIRKGAIQEFNRRCPDRAIKEDGNG